MDAGGLDLSAAMRCMIVLKVSSFDNDDGSILLSSSLKGNVALFSNWSSRDAMEKRDWVDEIEASAVLHDDARIWHV